MSSHVSKVTTTVAGMLVAAQKGRTLQGGTRAMQAAGEDYLPKFKVEDPIDYQARLASSWLYNGFSKTIKDMTGRVFATPIEINKGSNKLKEWSKDINLQGMDLSAFAKQVFADGFTPGISYIMVDAPRRDAKVTRAEADAAGLRPYMSHLSIEDLLGWKTTKIGNQTKLSQLRIFERVNEPDPNNEFVDLEIGQIRVLTLDAGVVTVRIYREKNKEWSIFDEYPTEASEITVVPFYAQRSGFFTGEPVLEDLADLNIAHWQSQSDQRNILHVARVPVLFATGITEGTEIEVSASQAVTSDNPDAKLVWVEHTGKAIEAGRNDLKDLEEQMRNMGLQLLVKQKQTATGAALDATKETSPLAAMADSLKDTLEIALGWMSDYGGKPEEVEVAVNTDFGLDALTTDDIKTLQADVSLGYLSLEEYYAERKRRGLLREDLDPQDDVDRMKIEGLGDDGDDS